MSDDRTIDALASIWRRLLKQPSIGISDHFFDLGGNPELATELFKEINAYCGVELPAVMIYQAPTLAALASLLTDSGARPQCPPLLLMQRGKQDPPIFFAHGMGGDAMQLFNVARHMDIPNSLYATQAPGIDGVTAPIDRIEDLAERYLHAIRNVQPKGPYLLIGFSFGGLVMMEVAQRLVDQGQTIGLLAMLDTYPHRKNISVWQQLPLVIRLGFRRLGSLGNPFKNDAGGQRLESHLEAARQRMHSAEAIAWRHYRPRFYPGKLYFVKAAVPTYYPRRPRAVWAPLVKEFELHTTPGSHTDVITTHGELTARLLTQQIGHALAQNQ